MIVPVPNERPCASSTRMRTVAAIRLGGKSALTPAGTDCRRGRLRRRCRAIGAACRSIPGICCGAGCCRVAARGRPTYSCRRRQPEAIVRGSGDCPRTPSLPYDFVLRLLKHLLQPFAAGGADFAVDLWPSTSITKQGIRVTPILLRELRSRASYRPGESGSSLARGCARGLHLHAGAALRRPEIQQENFGAAGREPERQNRQRDCRCRESDHPFPPWIGGRHAAAATKIAARASRIRSRDRGLRYRLSISILLIDAGWQTNLGRDSGRAC